MNSNKIILCNICESMSRTKLKCVGGISDLRLLRKKSEKIRKHKKHHIENNGITD